MHGRAQRVLALGYKHAVADKHKVCIIQCFSRLDALAAAHNRKACIADGLDFAAPHILQHRGRQYEAAQRGVRCSCKSNHGGDCGARFAKPGGSHQHLSILFSQRRGQRTHRGSVTRQQRAVVDIHALQQNTATNHIYANDVYI